VGGGDSLAGNQGVTRIKLSSRRGEWGRGMVTGGVGQQGSGRMNSGVKIELAKNKIEWEGDNLFRGRDRGGGGWTLRRHGVMLSTASSLKKNPAHPYLRLQGEWSEN